jgi:hypothetical protein
LSTRFSFSFHDTVPLEVVSSLEPIYLWHPDRRCTSNFPSSSASTRGSQITTSGLINYSPSLPLIEVFLCLLIFHFVAFIVVAVVVVVVVVVALPRDHTGTRHIRRTFDAPPIAFAPLDEHVGPT